MTAIVLSLMLVGAPDAGGCTKDVDCKGDRICVQGECKSPVSGGAVQGAPPFSPTGAPIAPGSPAPTTNPRRSRIPDDVANSVVGIQGDVQGFLLYGPTISLEMGSKVAFVIRGRAVSAGLIPHVLASSDEDTLELSWGAGAGLHFYTGDKANRQGLYVGFSGEYIAVDTREGDDDWGDQDIHYLTKMAVMAFDIGYRWVFEGGATLGLGGIIGYAKGLGAETTNLTSEVPDGYRADDSDRFVPLLVVELGHTL